LLRELEKGNRRFKARQLFKPACFLVLVVFLFVFSKATVTYTLVPAGAPELPQNVRDKVIITSLNGEYQTAPQDPNTEDDAPLITFELWNMSSNQILIQPQMLLTPGCISMFNTVIDLKVATANSFQKEEIGTMNITLWDHISGQLIASRAFVLVFKPGVPQTVNTSFSVTSDVLNPVYLAKVAFPNATELKALPAIMVQVPLYKYLLLQAGIISISTLT
jgi:hypothetical protein